MDAIKDRAVAIEIEKNMKRIANPRFRIITVYAQ